MLTLTSLQSKQGLSVQILPHLSPGSYNVELPFQGRTLPSLGPVEQRKINCSLNTYYSWVNHGP